MNILKCCIIFAMTSFAIFNFGQAQWRHTDTLCTGNVNDLIEANGFLFACSGNGIYRSSDHGLHWNKTDNGINTKDVHSLGRLGTILFAGTANEGIFFSTSNGAQWNDVSGGLSITNVTGFAVFPAKESGDLSVFATFHDTLYDGCVYRTTDTGSHWSSVSNGITNNDTRSLAVHDSALYVGTMGGVFLSTDEGIVWTPMNSGLNVTYIVTLLARDTFLFAGTMTGGAYRTSNHGNSWEPINNGLTNTYVNTFAATNTGLLFAGTGWSGVFLSTNNGTKWNTVSTGLTTSQINALIVDSGGTYLYAATDDGVWYRPLSDMFTGTSGKNDLAPERMELLQNFPNPFNSSTTIHYSLSSTINVKLTMHDVLGREIARLVNEIQTVGWQEIKWNASTVSSGIYFCRLQTGQHQQLMKIAHIK